MSGTDLVNEDGWVTVDRHTMETGHPGVYAIGDITRIPLEVGKPLPMAGVFAERQATVVAGNIATAITGEGTSTKFNGHGECFIETGAGKARVWQWQLLRRTIAKNQSSSTEPTLAYWQSAVREEMASSLLILR